MVFISLFCLRKVDALYGFSWLSLFFPLSVILVFSFGARHCCWITWIQELVEFSIQDLHPIYGFMFHPFSLTSLLCCFFKITNLMWRTMNSLLGLCKKVWMLFLLPVILATIIGHHHFCFPQDSGISFLDLVYRLFYHMFNTCISTFWSEIKMHYWSKCSCIFGNGFSCLLWLVL